MLMSILTFMFYIYIYDSVDVSDIDISVDVVDVDRVDLLLPSAARTSTAWTLIRMTSLRRQDR